MPNNRRSAVQKKQDKNLGVTAADVHSDAHSEHSDWSHWVEDVFSSALDDHDDGISEGKSLHSRIKGGGKGVPGLQTQQVDNFVDYFPQNMSITKFFFYICIFLCNLDVTFDI